jgi:hypothetical protein
MPWEYTVGGKTVLSTFIETVSILKMLVIGIDHLATYPT